MTMTDQLPPPPPPSTKPIKVEQRFAPYKPSSVHSGIVAALQLIGLGLVILIVGVPILVLLVIVKLAKAITWLVTNPPLGWLCRPIGHACRWCWRYRLNDSFKKA